VAASTEQAVQVDRTVNGGLTWQVSPLPTSLFPTGWNGARVDFLNSQDGWLSVQPYAPPGTTRTSVILTSTDGGASWTVVSDAAPVSEISFLTPQTGWGISPDGTTLYRTSDGGETWQQVPLPSPNGGSHSGAGTRPTLSMPVFFGDRGVLLAVPLSGNAVIETTSDAGQSWNRQNAPFRPEPVYPQIAATTVEPSCSQCSITTHEPFAIVTSSDWVYWDGGRVYTTRDAGRTWRSTQPNVSFYGIATSVTTIGGQPIPASSDPLQFPSTNEGWAVATVESRSVLLKTNDVGHHFAVMSPPTAPLF
jgi:photosystem II stability/assembly factor-like uncharacterized protein